MTTQTTSPLLLSSFKLGDLPLKNRVVMAPLTRSRAGEARMPNALMAEYYTQRASAGLIITEATVVSTQANVGSIRPVFIQTSKAKLGNKS